MSTRTIEPIHIVLPDADGGYYRFGELPRLIAEALKPDTEEADADPQGDYYVFRALDQMDYEKDLPQAAALPPGEPGYLHVVENSASKRPLKWRTGAVLDAGLVHLDWLNEWGESRKPPHVFSTVSAPEPQAEAPRAAPVVAENSYKVQGTARRNLLTPAIEAAQRMCENQFDAPAVWAVLVQMAQDGKRPLVGVTEDGIKWNDAEDNPQFLTLKNLRDHLRQKKKKAL